MHSCLLKSPHSRPTFLKASIPLRILTTDGAYIWQAFCPACCARALAILRDYW